MRLLYFAWVRQTIGREAEDVTPPASVTTVGALLDWLAQESAAHAAALADRSRIRVAVNQDHVDFAAPVAPGDEVAIFPPVTGGGPRVRVQAEPFDAGAELNAMIDGRRDIGAAACFVGICRDHGAGGAVTAMTLEHYPAMTARALEAIAAEASARWPLEDLRIVHRFGRLEPADPIVLVIALSAHRAAAFEAAAFLMDYLKTRAPFWKAEEGASGTRWVEAREADDAAAARWDGPPVRSRD